MSNKAEIVNELMEISPLLAGMERINPYSVPAGYFEGLDEHLLTLAKVEDHSSALRGIAMKNPMQVPSGYFDSLAGSILDKIKAEENPSVEQELRSLSPMLYAMDKVNVFSVPAGYFESLSDDLLNKVSPKEAKIVSFTRSKTISWMRFAAAAMVVGLVGMFSFFLLNNNNKLDKAVKQGIEYAKNNTFEEVLNKTSDEAIASYLDKTADEADAIQMVASVDQSQLPSEEELMSDEKLLDELLKESENKTSN